METALFLSIAAVPIVATKYPVFPSAKVPASLPSIYISRKPSPISAATLVTTRVPVEIMKISPTEKEKSPFQPILTTVFPSAKVPAR